MNKKERRQTSKDVGKNLGKLILALVFLFCATLMITLALFEVKSNFHEEYISLTKFEVHLYEHQKAMLDMETGVRGYIITQNETFLEPYNAGLSEKQAREEALLNDNRALNYSFESNLRKILQESDRWLTSIAFPAIANVRKNKGSSEEFKILAKSRFDNYRATFKNLSSNIANKQKQTLSEIKSLSIASYIIVTLVSLFFIIFVYYLLRKKIHEIILHYNQLIINEDKQLVELQKAMKSKDLFLANMSHEIRTPLGAIIGFSDLASQDPDLKLETKSHLNFIKRNSSHLLGLIEDLFDLSKVASNKLELFYERTDLQEALKDVFDIFSSKVKLKNQNLEFNVMGEIPKFASLDPLRFKQVLTNLIGNSVKFTDFGKNITVNATFDGKNLIFNIIDEGIGIDKKIRETIYTAFQQANSEHSRLFGGAGLGLSISKKLVSMMNGSLDLVWSRKGVGSHFRLSIPILKIETESFNNANFHAKFEENTTENNTPFKSLTLKSLKLLIAEDSQENQVLFKIFLETAGAEVEIVDNGGDAVRKALAGSYDCILMDIQMPGMDGYEAVKILRDAEYNGQIIALTAHAMKGDKNKALSSGFNAYLSKPVNKNNLVKTIKEITK